MSGKKDYTGYYSRFVTAIIQAKDGNTFRIKMIVPSFYRRVGKKQWLAVTKRALKKSIPKLYYPSLTIDEISML